MSDWLPIDTAPIEGTRVLLWFPDFAEGHKAQIGRYSHNQSYANGKLQYETRRWHINGGWIGFGAEEIVPSRWMPLPTEPAG